MPEQGTNGLVPESEEIRAPSMLDAVTPVVALIGFIALSVYLFGLDSTNGALQVGLFTAMTIAGVIPTIVDYGLRLLNPNLFYPLIVVICAATGAVTGSSWTTAGTLGVAFVGIAQVMGLSPEITAGAVISGSYFGDKMSPLSETTILVPSLVGGVTTAQHIRNMIWTTGPAILLSLLIFLGISLRTDVTASAANVEAARAVLGSAFNISPICLA